MQDVAVGAVVGGFMAIGLFAVWGFLGYLGIAAFGAQAPTTVNCTTHEELGFVNATLSARLFLWFFCSLSAVVGVVAIGFAARFARNRQPGAAVALAIVVFFGMAPAAMCDASAISKC